MIECIDLKKVQDKYRVSTSDSYFAETGSTTNSNTDPWHWEIRGARGSICPWGGEYLGLCMDRHPKLAAQLAREPWVDVENSQYGDDGINAVFHISHLDLAAEYAKSYVRPVLSDAERHRRVEAGRRLSTKRKKAAPAGPSNKRCDEQRMLF